jgi:hypothetical protein
MIVKTIVMLGLAVPLLMAASANAAFTFSQTQLENLTLQRSANALDTLLNEDTGPTYYDGTPMIGIYGYSGPLEGNGDGGTPGDDWVEIGKTHVNMLGQTVFGLTLSSDDDDPYKFWLYATDGTTTKKTAELIVPGPQHSYGLSLDLSGSGLNLADVELGFGVTNNKLSGDTYYVSANPVPTPGALFLGGLGSVLVGWLWRKKALV